jgi:predicted HTH transcriptional regulator
MTNADLLARLALGEDSMCQFKVDVRNVESLAAEMAAFANTNGGTIYIGVADDGSTPGLSQQDVARINQLISNAASQGVRSPLTKVFDGALAFVMRNLRKVQAGRGVNAPGTPEIPETVFEELLVNALVHRDYLVSASIRLFIFDNRIEIISPGHLPNNLTVEKIRAGSSNIRNPILVSYVAKGLLPYHGLGSGIKRALNDWSQIDFVDDHEGCLFTVTVHRTPVGELELAGETTKTSVETSGRRREIVGKAPLKRRERFWPRVGKEVR